MNFRLGIQNRGVHQRIGIISWFLLIAGLCSAGTISYTGALASPEDTSLITITLSATSDVTLQTFSFGGGTNGAANTILAGGFDPFVGLFQGTGPTALFLDGTSDTLSNYLSEPSACPPAGLVTIGSVAGQCGDVRLQFNGLAAGMYTVLLSDADYVPNAVYEATGYLADGFSDLTGGVFETCYDANDCNNNDTTNWALDIITAGGTSPSSSVPEPASLLLTGLGIVVVSRLSSYRRHSQLLHPRSDERGHNHPVA
jgi:hypothetical protein